MALQEFHKEAIVNLINSLTSSLNPTAFPYLNRLKNPQQKIDLSTLNKLGLIITKFEQVFRPNNHTLSNGSNDIDTVKFNYGQQISNLVNYIENSELFNIKDIESAQAQSFLEQQQPTFQHIQALLFIIRDWLCQFYLDKNFIYNQFPSIQNPNEVFSLANVKEYNICIIALLIFHILYISRHSFPEYQKVLEFSKICFVDLDSYINLATLDREFIGRLLQNSLYDARLEEEQDAQINGGLIKQIETLRNKICSTQKRLQNISHIGIGSGVGKVGSTSAGNIGLGSKLKMPATSSRSSGNKTKRTPLSDEPKPFKCDICTKSFPTSYKLNRHSYSHSGERPYVCTWENCMKRFNDNYHLRRHMNTHTGEKPFHCKAVGCTKRYSRAEDLRNHQKTHFNDGGRNNSGHVHISNSGHSASNHTSDIQALVQASQQQHNASSPSTIDHHQILVQSQLNHLQQQIQLQNQAAAAVASSQQHPQTSQFTNLSPNQVIADDSVLQPTIILQEQLSPQQNNNQGAMHMSELLF